MASCRSGGQIGESSLDGNLVLGTNWSLFGHRQYSAVTKLELGGHTMTS